MDDFVMVGSVSLYWLLLIGIVYCIRRWVYPFLMRRGQIGGYFSLILMVGFIVGDKLLRMAELVMREQLAAAPVIPTVVAFMMAGVVLTHLAVRIRNPYRQRQTTQV